jgi:2-iminobutanoate/2-iminopropanoate deaminase
MTIERYPHSLPLPLSSAVRAGGFVFLSGVVAVDSQGKVVDGDIRVQTAIVLKNIEDILRTHGLSFQDVVKATVWLADLSDAPAFNEEYRRFVGSNFPTRSAVESKLYGGARVEVEVQAWAGERQSSAAAV